MQYNPHREELNQLRSELVNATTERDRLRVDRARYEAFDVAHVEAQRLAVEAAIQDRKWKVEQYAERLEVIGAAIADFDRRSSLGINPRFWFSPERSKLLQQLKEAKVVRITTANSAADAQKSLQAAQGKAKKIDEATSWYRTLDRAAVEATLGHLTNRIEEIRGRLPSVELLAAKLDRKLAPILADLSAAQARKDGAVRRIADAQKFDDRLSSATGSEKRTIHQECNAKLGHDGPAYIISRERRVAEGADRDIEKLKRSAVQVAERGSRKIDCIVFDGNNLCYARSKEFIGIAPLQAITRALTVKARKIIVFDASIRRHGFNERKLTEAIGGDIRVHIVNGAADETILDLAADENSYVVSNDKFVDYRAKPAVARSRIFRHECVDNRVMIHELEVSTSYA